MAFSLVQAGLLQGKSVGFLPLKYHAPSYDEIAQAPALKSCSRVLDEWLLLEYACTWMPTNGEAVVEAISKGQVAIPEDLLSVLGLDPKALTRAKSEPPTPGCPEVVKFTALDQIEQALVRRVEQIDLGGVIQDVFDRARGRV